MLRDLERRLRLFRDAERKRGASWPGTLVVGAPREAARIVRDGVTAAWNRRRLRRRAPQDAAAVRRAFAAAGEGPCVVVAVPGLLHLLVPAVRLALRRRPVIVVLNGLSDSEESALRGALPGAPTVRLDPLPGTLLAHGAAIDVVLAAAPGDFTLLDPDLFVFDATLFDELRLRPGEAAAGTHGFTNSASGLRFPRTHLLALEVERLRELGSRYGVGAETRRWTPRRLVAPLAGLGLGDHNHVKAHLGFFDTLTLLLAAALAEGARLRVIDAGEERCHHVGGVSHRRADAARAYLDRRLLDVPGARAYSALCGARFGAPFTAIESREALVAGGGETAAAEVDALVERLSRALTESA